MKLLQLCVAAAIAAGMTAGPHVARAQALGEAATLNAGVSTAGSASASVLGNSLGRTMRNQGARTASSSKTSTSGGVVNLHWKQEKLERSTGTKRTQANGNAKVGSEKAQPDFVILGADPQDADSEDASVTQPKAAHPSASEPKPPKRTGSSGQDEKN
ncbi:MAG TPA: hypothetical protein VFW25_02150 [Silvibacterium sp.]|nr:hypothetical protein [Silvibacterium sp.]